MKNRESGFIPILVLIVGAVAAFALIRPSLKFNQTQPVSTTVSPVASSSAQVKTEAQQEADLTKYLTVEAALLGISDNMSLYFKDLNQGKQVTIDPTKSWIPASTIKAYVVLEAFRQRDLGLINFDQSVIIQAQNVVPTELETDEFPRLREGTVATVKQLVEAMIIQSDNTAYNTLIDILDRRNINLALKNIGLTETVVGEKLNLDQDQFQQDLQVPGRQPNTTTVKDLGGFFELLYNKKIADADEIISIFKRQKINNMIPALLPQNTVVAHKTGDWAPIYHDGGVIFKPDDPFILTVFTNSGDPSNVAQLAKVAYYQNADSVGKDVSTNTQSTRNVSLGNIYTYPEDQVVLAAEQSTTDQQFPTVTASDLGISPKDLNSYTQQAKDLRDALITPGSWLYKIKTALQNTQLQTSTTNEEKVTANLNLAKDRLSEVKTLLSNGDVAGADQLLHESEGYLTTATDIAKNDPNKDLLLVEIKQVNDLHFAALADRASQVPQSQKEQFINTIYNFYQDNQKKVTPTVNASVIANPIQQKPAIGQITNVAGNQATIQFDDGSSKQMLLTDDLKVRSFQQQDYQDKGSLGVGDKIAVVGLTNSSSQIVPQFILKNVPKELPEKHEGTVIEINPDQNTLKILDQKGQQEIIQVGNGTTIKSTDTNVSLEGIKAGSEVAVFGTTQPVVSATNQPGFNLNFLPGVGNIAPISSPNPITSQSSASAVGGEKPLPSASIRPSGSSSPNSSNIPTASPGFGTQTTPGSSNKPSGSSNPLPSASTGVKASTKPASGPTSSPQPLIQLKATSITVTNNSSGKREVTKPSPTKSSPAKASPPQGTRR